MKYALVIFDLDGTILDTLEDLKNAANYALVSQGYPPRAKDEIRRFVGNGIHKLIERAVPAGTTAEAIDRTFAAFNEYYVEHCADNTKPYAGIPELLARLRGLGIKTAVVSNKADYGVQALCEQYFPGLFDFAVGEREGIRRKPAPDSVNETLQHLEMPRAKAVYVGDSEVDLQTANNAGLEHVVVAWGFKGRAFLEENGALNIADSCADLEAFLGLE